MRRHGPIYTGTCKACGADNVPVQLYTDDIQIDPIALCIDANAKACMDRQFQESLERGCQFDGGGE